jgi:predicted enzyme related to lactoylglutathione lyase
MAGNNTVRWFEIGSADPEATEQYYGGLFGWTFTPEEGEIDYRLVSAEPAGAPSGGVRDHGGRMANYAIFHVQVEDVAAAVARAVDLGGTVVAPPTRDTKGLVHAQLADPAGSTFGVFSEPPRS